MIFCFVFLNGVPQAEKCNTTGTGVDGNNNTTPFELMYSPGPSSSMKHKICVDVQDYVIPAAAAASMQPLSAISLTYALALLQDLASSILKLCA